MPRKLAFLHDLAMEARMYDDLEYHLDPEDFVQLTKSAREHAESHGKRRPLDGEGLILVHPFFRRVEAFLYGLPDADEKRRMDNIRRAAGSASEKMPVILVDDFPSYTLRSGDLAEEGLIDRVIFTRNLDPKPYRPGDNDKLGNLRRAFLCGCYGRGRCLSSYFIWLYKANTDTVVHIKDAILYSPAGPLIKDDTPLERQYMQRTGITTDQFVGMISEYPSLASPRDTKQLIS